MSMINSILFNTDSYKVSMWKQYPPGTEYVYSYIEPRGGNLSDHVVFFGLQAFIKDYLLKPVTAKEVALADKFWTAHGEPFNREGWDYIVREHGGYLPIRIKSVPEGTRLPTSNVVATVENTDPKCFWLTTWVETALLRAVWYPSNVATTSYKIKKLIKLYLEETGDVSLLDFKLHDFGARGCQSNETAALGAMAHLLNFKGTDTFVGVVKAVESYGANFDAVGFSIPAAEHSTITSWGRENETKAYANMIDNFSKPGSIYAVVSDSYNIFKACDLWGTELKDKIISSGGTLVIRPDSGDPVEVLRGILPILEVHFGTTLNAKGYKVLNHVRVIWGDGINKNSIERILEQLTRWKFSTDNIAFGMGGALLGAPQRDDLGWAMKCSAIRVNGEWLDVFKDPITASNKASKRGLVTLYKSHDGSFYSGVEDWPLSALVEVYKNGKLLVNLTFDQVRANLQ